MEREELTNRSSWFVRTYEAGDEVGILELMKMDGIERTLGEWVWEYEKSPLGHLSGVAEYEGKIVGHMGLIAYSMKLGDKIVNGSQAVDLIVDPDFRGRGIFLAIGKMLTETAGKKGIPLSYGFPNRPAHAGHLKYGWFDVCDVPELVKPMKFDKLVGSESLDKYRIIKFLIRYRISRKIVSFLLRVALNVVSVFNRVFNRTDEVRKATRIGAEGIAVLTLESFDDRFDEFWKEASTNHSITVIRNKRYLNWRFVDKPNSKYTLLSAERSGKILGYVVLCSRERKNMRLGYIVDILVSSENRGIVQSLLSEAIKKFRKENVDAIICWMLKDSASSCNYYKALKYNGFVHLVSHPLIARVNSSQLSKEFAADSCNWFITIGDSDYY